MFSEWRKECPYFNCEEYQGKEVLLRVRTSVTNDVEQRYELG